jgi:hypothetical protein
VFRVILAKDADMRAGVWSITRVDCGNSHEKLPCRLDKSYSQFLLDVPSCDWRFRVDDDTFTNITVFCHLLLHFNTIYDLKKDIEFQGYANREGIQSCTKWRITEKT